MNSHATRRTGALAFCAVREHIGAARYRASARSSAALLGRFLPRLGPSVSDGPFFLCLELAWPPSSGGTRLDFDGHMAEAGNIRQALLVGGRWLGPVGDNRHHGGAVTGADLPEMKVGDAIAA